VPQDEVDVRVCDEPSTGVDGVGVSRPPDTSAVDDLADRAQVDVRNDNAFPWRPLGDGHGEVRQPVIEVHRAEVPLPRPREEELRAAREIRARPEAVRVQRRRSHLLPTARVDVAHPADRAVAVEQAMEVLIALSPAGTSAHRSRLCDGIELQQEVLYKLLDRRCGR